MPRLLHILAQRPGRSGSGVFLKNMVREAARRGYEQHVIVAGPAETSHQEVPPLRSDELSLIAFPSTAAPFPVPGASDVMPYASTVFSRMTELQLEQYCQASRQVMERVRRDFCPDIVHAHHLWLMTALARRVFAQTPLVATPHNTELRLLINAPHLAPRVLPEVRRVDRIGVLTPRSRLDTVDAFGVRSDRLVETGAGFREDLFAPPAESRQVLLERLRREHGVSLPEARFVTYVGRLSSAKGIPYLLRAVRRIVGRVAESPAVESSGPPMKLLLIGASGSGDDGRHMDELVRQAGDAALHLGTLPQAAIALVLQCSDLFVLPSLFEGLPLVMLEAAACGCPCLVSGLPTIESWISRAWIESGVFTLVPKLEVVRADQPLERDIPRFVADLADLLQRRLDSPPALEARRRLAEDMRRHSWSAVFGRYEALYERPR